MSALPTAAFFRRFALPVHFATAPSGDIGCRPLSSLSTHAIARPRLVAIWGVDADERPVCRWTVQHRVLSAPG